MRRLRPKKKDDGDDWLMTYSDLMTLLLVFFVLLFSFSQIDVIKFQRFIASFQGQGILNRGDAPLEQVEPESSRSQIDEQIVSQINSQKKLQQMYQKTVKYLEARDLSDKVEVKYSERGVAIDIKEKVLFDSGEAVLKPGARELLNRLSSLFAEVQNYISVEGHTDNRPINTIQYPTNWELSVDRSVKVIRYLTEEQGLSPYKFVAVGHSKYDPIVVNSSAENRAENRRVVMVITSKKVSSEVHE